MKSKLSIILVAICLSAGCTSPISKRHQEKPPALLYSLDNKDKLIKMAEKRFGKLTEADEILFAAVMDGNWADYQEGGDIDKIENAESWGEKRILRTDRIEWLCHDKNAKELVTDKGILVIGAKIKGEVDLSFADIPFPLGFFECVFTDKIVMQYSRIKFLNLDGSHTSSIWAEGVKVESHVFLRNDFKAEGTVSFPKATIGGEFNCTNGKFIGESGWAIVADEIEVKGSVFFEYGFKANGEVRFLQATVGGTFNCVRGEFINKGGKALSADRIKVEGGVFLQESKVEGIVSFVGAIVDGFNWTDVNLTEKTVLDVRNAKAEVLFDDVKSWPKKGNLFLDGFVYENISDYAPKDAKSRIEWLNRQSEDQFRPGPYEQLAKVLEKIGYDEDAVKIHIEEKDKLTRLSSFGWWKRIWKGYTIGYGYRPWRALWWIGGFIVLGFIVFRKGYKAGIIVQTEEKKYNKFNALIYSIEVFVPVLDLRMAKHWIPDANKRWGTVVRCYMWFHIIAGWVLTTLLIVGLTGLIK